MKRTLFFAGRLFRFCSIDSVRICSRFCQLKPYTYSIMGEMEFLSIKSMHFPYMARICLSSSVLSSFCVMDWTGSAIIQPVK